MNISKDSKRSFIVSIICILALLFASTAHAEHKLLITDVLEARQIQARADYIFSHSSRNYSYTSDYFDDIVTVRTSSNALSLTSSLGFGLGYGLQLNISAPLSSSIRSRYDFSLSNNVYSFKRHGGWQDLSSLSLGLKYRVFGDAKTSSAVIVGFSSLHIGPGKEPRNPYLAASTLLNSNIRLCAKYKAHFAYGRFSDSHNLSTGVEYEISKALTLTPSLSATYFTPSKSTTAHKAYSFNIASYIQVYRNFYWVFSKVCG